MGKSCLCSLCILTICDFSYCPFLFLGLDFGSNCFSSWSLHTSNFKQVRVKHGVREEIIRFCIACAYLGIITGVKKKINEVRFKNVRVCVTSEVNGRVDQ